MSRIKSHPCPLPGAVPLAHSCTSMPISLQVTTFPGAPSALPKPRHPMGLLGPWVSPDEAAKLRPPVHSFLLPFVKSSSLLPCSRLERIPQICTSPRATKNCSDLGKVRKEKRFPAGRSP